MNTLNYKEFIEFVKENILEPDKLTIGINWAKNHLSQATNDSTALLEEIRKTANSIKVAIELADVVNENIETKDLKVPIKYILNLIESRA